MAAMILCSVAAGAQNWFVGGSFAIGSAPEGNDGTAVSILPELGYNINDQNTVGAVIGYENTTGEKGFFEIKPYYRRNLVSLGERVNLFVDGGVPMLFGDGVSIIGISIQPGISFDCSESIALVAHVGNFGFDVTSAGGTSVFSWEAGVNGAGLAIGVYFKF